jgi:hypothetical protein
MGHAIRKATSALGPKKRKEQIEAFSKIIEINATPGDGDSESQKIF